MKFGRSFGENSEAALRRPARRNTSKVVSLALLSDSPRTRHLAPRIARALAAESNKPIVLVRLIRCDADVVPTDFHLNGEFHFPSGISRTEDGFDLITLGMRNDPPTPEGIDSLISQLTRHFHYVLIEAPVDAPDTPWLSALLSRSNPAYLFVEPTQSGFARLSAVRRQMHLVSMGNCSQLKPVVCTITGEDVNEFDALAHRAHCPIHMVVRNNSSLAPPSTPLSELTGMFQRDIRRLAREISGRLVGLALSSGAAKGFAHIGVIQILEENGIDVDVVAGTSMGAYVGSLWSYGCDGAELERLARELEGRWTLWSLIDPVFPPRRGFLRGFAVKRRLMRTLGRARFSDLARPFRVVAANLATLERVVFSAGEVATAVHASIAVPGICVPITIDGETYADGGIVDPLPVDVLREMGVDRVIAVNVIPTPDRIRTGIQAEIENARNNGTTGIRMFGRMIPLERQVNYFARGNVLEILMRSVHGAQIRMAEAACEEADIVVRPDIYDDCWLDYRQPGKFIRLGREAARRQLDEIKSLVNRKEADHENELAPELWTAII